jgi:putative spermidine/putrescine transport system permease protein
LWTSLSSRLWAFGVWLIMSVFVVNLLALIAAVITSSLATRWLGTWLPAGWTFRWYASAWREFQLAAVLTVTFEIAFLVVALPA